MSKFPYFTWIFTILLIAPTLFALASRYWWICELFAHFCHYYVIVLTGGIVALLIGRRRMAALICFVCLTINLYHVVPYYWATESPSAATRTYRGMFANVLTRNQQYKRFLELVATEDPDMLFVMEVNSSWSNIKAAEDQRNVWKRLSAHLSYQR